MSKQRIKLHLDHLESNISPLSNTPVWPCMQCRNLLQCFFLQASPALENTHTGECAHLETGSNPHWDHSSQDVTLQATSTLTALPPNSVGGELGPTDLVGGALLCRQLLEAVFSQRWRKRVTSSWSSIVFICLREKRGEFHLTKRRIGGKKKKKGTTLFIVYDGKKKVNLNHLETSLDDIIFRNELTWDLLRPPLRPCCSCRYVFRWSLARTSQRWTRLRGVT